MHLIAGDATSYWSHLVYIYAVQSILSRVDLLDRSEAKGSNRMDWGSASCTYVFIRAARVYVRVCCLATGGLRRARRGHPSSFVALSVCACNNELARERFHYIRGCVEAVWFNLFLACTCVVWVGSQNCCNRPYQFTYCCWLMFINLFVVFWFKNKLNIR